MSPSSWPSPSGRPSRHTRRVTRWGRPVRARSSASAPTQPTATRGRGRARWRCEATALAATATRAWARWFRKWRVRTRPPHPCRTPHPWPALRTCRPAPRLRRSLVRSKALVSPNGELGPDDLSPGATVDSPAIRQACDEEQSAAGLLVFARLAGFRVGGRPVGYRNSDTTRRDKGDSDTKRVTPAMRNGVGRQVRDDDGCCPVKAVKAPGVQDGCDQPTCTACGLLLARQRLAVSGGADCVGPRRDHGHEVFPPGAGPPAPQCGVRSGLSSMSPRLGEPLLLGGCTESTTSHGWEPGDSARQGRRDPGDFYLRAVAADVSTVTFELWERTANSQPR